MAFELSALFLSALFAATILPGQSELGLAYLVTSQPAGAVLFIAVASIGNTLGSLVTWGLGLGVNRFKSRPWFPVSPERLAKAEIWYRGYGYWSLLLSWAPVIGDPLTLAAGVMREPFWRFLLLVAVAKTGRYLVVAAVAQGLV